MPSGNTTRLGVNFVRLAVLSQEVIALRLMRIAFGSVGAQREVRRMFIEKGQPARKRRLRSRLAAQLLRLLSIERRSGQIESALPADCVSGPGFNRRHEGKSLEIGQ